MLPVADDAAEILGDDDICINSTGTGTLGRVALLSKHERNGPRLVADGHVTLLRANRNVVEPRFLCYLLSTQAFYGLANACLAVGSTNQMELGRDAIRTLGISIPSLQQQRRIVEVLDHELERIDQLIQELAAMLALLGERFAAERGKRFGSEPGWPLKHLLARPMAYGVLVPRFVERGQGVRMLRIMNLTERGEIVTDEAAHIEVALSEEYQRTIVRSGDLILSVVGTMGRSAVVGEEATGSNLNRPMARLQPHPEIPSRLLWHWTKSPQFMDLARLATGWGTAQPTLNLGDLANFRVGLPSDKREWPTLLSELEEGAQTLYACEDEIRHQTLLLNEHKQSMVTAAVTGGVAAAGRCA